MTVVMMCSGIFFIDGLGWVTKTGPTAMSDFRWYNSRLCVSHLSIL